MDSLICYEPSSSNTSFNGISNNFGSKVELHPLRYRNFIICLKCSKIQTLIIVSSSLNQKKATAYYNAVQTSGFLPPFFKRHSGFQLNIMSRFRVMPEANVSTFREQSFTNAIRCNLQSNIN